MRILIAAAGSRGDVAPSTGLGADLRRAGHDVTLAAPDAFAPLAREAGLRAELEAMSYAELRETAFEEMTLERNGRFA